MVKVDGEKMKRARERKMLTTYQVRELTGISRYTLNRLEYEKGEGRPSTIKALARIYGVGPADLLPDEPDASKVTVMSGG